MRWRKGLEQILDGENIKKKKHSAVYFFFNTARSFPHFSKGFVANALLMSLKQGAFILMIIEAGPAVLFFLFFSKCGFSSLMTLFTS